MNDKELEKMKEELMHSDYTEDLHCALEKLQIEDAKKIVESMTDTEIGWKVNIRRHQEDYIADYLEYLWEISKSAYWRHVKITFDREVGILWSSEMLHFTRLCNFKIPDDVWEVVLNFALGCDEKKKDDLEVIGCVVKAQAEKFGRLEEIKKRISLLGKAKYKVANRRIKKMLNTRSKYHFYNE